MTTPKAKKTIIVFFIAVLAVIGLLLAAGLLFPGDSGNYPSEPTLFYGEECPHCKIVEEFMADNNVSEKINITMKESFSNETNAEELISVEKYCKIEPKYFGSVPLLFKDNKCYLGDSEIINFFKSELNIL